MNTAAFLMGTVVVIIFSIIVIYASLRAHRDNFLTSKLKRKRGKTKAIAILLEHSEKARQASAGAVKSLDLDKVTGKLIKKTGYQHDLELIKETYRRFKSGEIDRQAAVSIYEELEKKLALEASQIAVEIEQLDARLV